jgi:pimeloyl-ACP methyl ester carboxylesterase
LSSIEAYAAVLDEWIRYLSLEDVVLLGHSMGGAVVLAQALRRTSPIRGIVMIASGARLRVAEDILRRIKEHFLETVAALADAYWGPDAPAEAIQISRQRMQDAGSDLIYADLSVTDAFDVTGRLDVIQDPTLIIGGDRDLLTPPKYASYLARHIPNTDLHIIADAFHMVHHQQPRAVALIVRNFLDHLS